MNYITNIPIEIPRFIVINKESVTSVDLHALGDASTMAICLVYAVGKQASAFSKGLVVSKSCISIRDLTTPRLELFSTTHMTYNLIPNVQSTLKNQNVRSVTRETDRTVVLYWLNEQGNYNQFVRNRISKVLERNDIYGQYIPARENPT